jgi:hypothetical protein
MKLDKYDLKLVNGCAKEGRPMLQNVCVRKGQLAVADGFILVLREADMKPEEKEQEELLLPASMLKQVKFQPSKKPELSLADGKVKVTYSNQKGNPLEFEPEVSFKPYTESKPFPNYTELLNESPIKKTAEIAVSVGLLKRILSMMPDDGILRLGINTVSTPLEFQCEGMDRPIRGLIMPMFIDWKAYKWQRTRKGRIP